MSRIAVDFDGTLVKPAWPKIGEWYRGAPEAMESLREAGHYVFLYTARLAPEWPDGSPRTAADVWTDTARVRESLDSVGLQWLDIWTGNGKPNWDLLIDDKAMWFPGRDRSWKVMVPKILLRLEGVDSFDHVMAEAKRRRDDPSIEG